MVGLMPRLAAPGTPDKCALFKKCPPPVDVSKLMSFETYVCLYAKNPHKISLCGLISVSLRKLIFHRHNKIAIQNAFLKKFCIDSVFPYAICILNDFILHQRGYAVNILGKNNPVSHLQMSTELSSINILFILFHEHKGAR